MRGVGGVVTPWLILGKGVGGSLPLAHLTKGGSGGRYQVQKSCEKLAAVTGKKGNARKYL